MASTISHRIGKNRPVAVLGASGRLGQMLVRMWPRGADLVCHSTRPQTGFVVFDLILEPDQAVRALAGAGAVICLAGITPARQENQGDVYSRNTDLAIAAVQAAHRANAGRVFVASSAAVYGAAGGLLDEAGPASPVSDYGRAKLAMERAVLAEAEQLGHPVTVLRIGNVAGADAILGGWRHGMQIDQLADGGTPRRSYIGPGTLARVMHCLCAADELPEVLNVAAPGSVEMGALLDAAGLAWSPRAAPAGVIADVSLCTRRLEALFDFAPECSTAAGLVAEWHDFQGRG